MSDFKVGDHLVDYEAEVNPKCLACCLIMKVTSVHEETLTLVGLGADMSHYLVFKDDPYVQLLYQLVLDDKPLFLER